MKQEPNADELFAADLVDIIQNSRIFSGINPVACEELLPRLEKVILKQGKALFTQGDDSDCLYLLIEGQLIASLLTPKGKQKIVGIIEKGETVGELGAISNQPRSLTIRAAVDCRLVKLEKHQFEEFTKNHPQFISKIVDLVISRSQQIIKLITQNRIYHHIAIIKGDDKVDFNKFMEKLKANFQEKSKFVLIDDPTQDLANFLEHEEHENISVIFVLNKENVDNLKIKINHIGGIFVVVDGDHPNTINEFAIKMVSREKTPFTTQYDLILVHNDSVKQPKKTLHWLKQADFTVHHHIHKNDDLAYQRLLRFMKGNAIGIVLGGGGGKVWVHLGAIKALIDSGIPIDAIGGTSSGAGIAACYAANLTYEKTRITTSILAESMGNPFGLKNLTWPLISILSAQNMTENLQKIFSNILIENMWLPFFAISTNLTTGSEVVHRTGPLWAALRASSAVPGVLPPLLVAGDLHYDGGLLNNLPVDQMRHLLGDNSIVIASSLTGSNFQPQKYHFPDFIPFRVGLLKKLKLKYKDYVFPSFFYTFLQALLVGSSAKEKANTLNADIISAPDLSQFRSLDTNYKKINLMIEIGYQSMLDQLKKSPLKHL